MVRTVSASPECDGNAGPKLIRRLRECIFVSDRDGEKSGRAAASNGKEGLGAEGAVDLSRERLRVSRSQAKAPDAGGVPNSADASANEVAGFAARRRQCEAGLNESAKGSKPLARVTSQERAELDGPWKREREA